MRDANWKTVKRFSLAISLTVTAVIVTLVATPAGYWLLRRVIAVSEPIAQNALATLAAFAPLPLIRAWRQAYWGLLMGQRNTSMISEAKAANLAAVGGVLLLVFGFSQVGLVIPPSAVGALAYTLGEGVESMIIWRYAESRLGRCQKVAARA